MPLPSPAEASGAKSRRSRRTPSTDNNAPVVAGGSLAACPALIAPTSTVPGVPSGRRTIRHGTPPTRRRPSTASRSPHSG